MRGSMLLALPAWLLAIVAVHAQYDPPLSKQSTPKTGFDLPLENTSPRKELPDPKPQYNYELKPDHGEYVVFVKSFQGKFASDQSGKARELAEGLVEYIRTECRLYAFVHETGWVQRQERKKERETIEAKAREYYRSQGHTPAQVEDQIRRMTKMARIPDEYAVFVAPGKGTLKNFDEALEFAKYIRKLKSPPAEFCDAVVVGTEQDLAQQKGEPKNPFLLAMPGRNPTLPKKEVAMERPKADDFLMNLNAGKSNSLIHNTKKKFTLVVKSYGTSFGQVQKPGEIVAAGGKSDGELLERAAYQAHKVAEMLRSMKPVSYDAYVLHTRYESFVCVGEYDSQDDPQLKANADALKAFQIRNKTTGEVLDTFMEKPMPAMIPRP